MNRRLIFTLVFTLVFLVSVGSVATFVPSAAKNEPPTAAEVTKSEYTGYIIKDFYGKVAVFRSGEDNPIQITDTLTSSLPELDRAQLSDGVTADDEAQLKRLLEDYCS